jgi:HNH endonuclease
MQVRFLPLEPLFPELGPARLVNGYVAYFTKENPTLYEHRVAVERRLGRLLLAGEIVHHKNKVRSDNADKQPCLDGVESTSKTSQAVLKAKTLLRM